MSATDAPILDADIVPDDTADVGTDVAIVDPIAGAIIRADEPDEILKKATGIANVLAGLIEQQGLAKDVGGRKKHVEVGGWQALGTMLGAFGGQPLHAETQWTRPLPDGDGWEACVEIRTPGGVVVGRAEAMCDRSESKWRSRDNYAIRSMAETRAESRAFRRAVGWIVALAGYNPTPAEEMPDQGPAAPPVPRAEGKALTNAANAIALMLKPHIDDDDERQAQALFVLGEIERDAGCDLSRHHAGALALAAKAILAAQNVTTAPEGEAAPESAPTGPQEDAAPPAASSTPNPDDEIPF